MKKILLFLGLSLSAHGAALEPQFGMVSNDRIGQEVVAPAFGNKLAAFQKVATTIGFVPDSSCLADLGFYVVTETLNDYEALFLTYKAGGLISQTIRLQKGERLSLPGNLTDLYVDAFGKGRGTNAPIVRIGMDSRRCGLDFSFRGILSDEGHIGANAWLMTSINVAAIKN